MMAPRDLDLLTTLTSCVRILAMSQLEQLWGAADRNRRSLERRLLALSKAGLIELHIINAHVLTPARPLFAWQPGKPEPDPATLSHEARTRWRFAAAPTDVCVPSRLTANLMGSTAFGLPKLEHRDHDLLLSAAYLHYRTARKNIARCWLGECVLAKAGYHIKDPDAFLRDGQGKVFRVIESSGSYSRDQVESFHEHCAERELPYELW
jgi:hypothetical protein